MENAKNVEAYFMTKVIPEIKLKVKVEDWC
jgi:hypothetical protein